MKFDLDKPILDLAGEEVKAVAGKPDPLTMKMAIRQALVTMPREPLKPEESVRRYDLQARLAAEGPAEISASEIVLIQHCLVAIWGPLVVGQVSHALNEPMGGGNVAKGAAAG